MARDVAAVRVWPATLPRYRTLAAAGLVAGVLGGILYVVGASTFYARVDRVPLDADVRRTLGLLVGPGAADTLTHRLLDRRLVITAAVPQLVAESPYSALRRLESAMDAARRLLKRIDTARVTLLVRTDGAEVLRFESAEGDESRPVWDLAVVHRQALRNAGRVDLGSLQEMREFTAGLQGDFETRDRLLRFALTDAEVAMTFVPPGPLGPDTAAAFAFAWGSANNVLRETTRYFPEVARFRVDLPGLQTLVSRQEVRPEFILQHRLLPPGRVLGILVRRGDPAEQVAEPAWWAVDRERGVQVALAVFNGPLASYPAARLFEEVNLTPGFLYISGISPEGTATFFLGDERKLRGPFTLRAGATLTVDGAVITGAGWLPPDAFRRPPERR